MSTAALLFTLSLMPHVALSPPPLLGAATPAPLPDIHFSLTSTMGATLPFDTELASERAVDASLGEAIARRNTLGTWHRVFGISTWVAMTATVVIGSILFHDKYGFGSATETPCARNEAILGSDVCSGIPIPHAIAGITSTVLYAATATISFLLPDPLDLAHAEGQLADRLSAHKMLRWIHMAAMVATIAFGLVANNVETDFEAKRALAAVHLGLGFVTWGALTTAGALMTF